MTTQWWPTPRSVANPGWQVTQRIRFADEPSIPSANTAATFTVIATTNQVSLVSRPAADGHLLVVAVDWRHGIRGPITPADGVDELVATGPGRYALINELITGARQIAEHGWSFIALPTQSAPTAEGVPATDDFAPRLFDVTNTTLTA